jgi:hypothetical protein
MINSHARLHLMVEDASLKVEVVSWLDYEKSLRCAPCSSEYAAMRLARGVTMVARETQINHLCRSNDFFIVKACTPLHLRVRQ